MKKSLVLFVALLVIGGLISVSVVKADDALVSALATLFKGLTQAQIDDAVAEAKSRLVAQAKLAQESDLEKLFDSQIATLKDRGVPEQIVEIFQGKKDLVLKKASEMTIGDGNTAFLPVITPAYLGYYGLMSLVRSGSYVGYSYINPTLVKDQVQIPDDLYYIYDVEDGTATRGKSAKDADEIFKRQKRFSLTATEIIALAVHTSVLTRHNLLAVGSRRGDDEVVAFLWLGGGGPVLRWVWAYDSSAWWGSASCGSR